MQEETCAPEGGGNRAYSSERLAEGKGIGELGTMASRVGGGEEAARAAGGEFWRGALPAVEVMALASPEAAEMAACRPWLERQIALLRPRVIVLLGKAAVHSLLHDDKSLASLRGRRFEYQGIPVVVTYHPAYLLRNPEAKKQVWEDVQLIMKALQ